MIRYGTNPIAWSNDDDRTLGAHISLEECLGDAAAIGFDGIEKGHKLPQSATALKATLGPYGLAYVSGWHSLNLLARSVEAEKAALDPVLDLLEAMGSRVCIVCETSNAIHGDDAKPLSRRPISLGRGMARLRRRRRGARRALRESAGSTTPPPPRLPPPHGHRGAERGRDRSADARDGARDEAPPRHRPRLLRRGRPGRAGAQAHGPRAPHPRQERPPPPIKRAVEAEGLSFLAGVRRGVFTVPGDPEGGVDFLPVLRVAAERGYDGWLVIEAEQDPAARDPKIYQRMGLEALRRLAREGRARPPDGDCWSGGKTSLRAKPRRDTGRVPRHHAAGGRLDLT